MSIAWLQRNHYESHSPEDIWYTRRRCDGAEEDIMNVSMALCIEDFHEAGKKSGAEKVW